MNDPEVKARWGMHGEGEEGVENVKEKEGGEVSGSGVEG